MDGLRVDASTIGTGGIGPVVEEPVDLPADDSATVQADGDAGASIFAGVAAGAAVIGTAGYAAGDASLVNPDLEKEEIEEGLKKRKLEAGEGSKKRKFEEVAPDQEVVEPAVEPLVENVVKPVAEPPVENVVEPAVEPLVENVLEPAEPPVAGVVEPVEPPVAGVVEPVEPPYADVVESDSSLEYDSQDSAESVDNRNIESFKRNVLKKLQDGTLCFKKRGRFYCPWHMAKPKDGVLGSLRQHAKELSHTGTSKKMRAQHALLLQVLAGEGDA